MYPMIARILVESARKALGTHGEQRTTPEVLGFDTTSMPVELALPSRPRSPLTVDLAVVHVTDVDGGFGVSARAVKRWRGLLERGKVPRELLVQLPDPDDLGGSSFLLALLERYSGCAYHGLGSRRAGAIRNHPVSLRTSHGNGGNAGVGWALDAGHREVLDEAFASIGRQSLSNTIVEAHEESGNVIRVAPHRAFSKARRVDTDPIVWRAIVKPVVLALGPSVCRIDYEVHDKREGGLPICDEWDDDALYDAKGRRLTRAA